MNDSDPGPYRHALVLTTAVWLIYAVSAGGSLATGDAVAMLEQAKSILDRGALDIPATQSAEGWRGADGRYHSPFGIGQSLYDIPWLVLGRSITAIGGVRLVDSDTLPKALVAFGNSFAAAGAVGFTFLLAARISNDLRSSAVAALVLAFGTLLWPYSKYGFNAPLAAGGLTMGVCGFIGGTTAVSIRALAFGGIGFGVALLTRHELVLAAIVALIWLAGRARGLRLERRHVAAATAGIAVALVAWSALNYVRFGDPLRTGHQPDFSFAGLAGFTVSPWGSLLLYSPAAVVGLAMLWTERSRPWTGLVAGIVLVLGTFYASLDDWLGTRSYGPRYLVPLLPLLVAPLALWWARPRSRRAGWALLGACVLGLAVQLPPVLVDFSRARIAAKQPSRPESLLDWRSSPLIVTGRSSITALVTTAGYASGAAPLPQFAEARGVAASERLVSLDLWWLYLVYLRAISLPTALAIAAGMLAVSGLLLRRLWIDLAI